MVTYNVLQVGTVLTATDCKFGIVALGHTNKYFWRQKGGHSCIPFLPDSSQPVRALPLRCSPGVLSSSNVWGSRKVVCHTNGQLPSRRESVLSRVDKKSGELKCNLVLATLLRTQCLSWQPSTANNSVFSGPFSRNALQGFLYFCPPSGPQYHNGDGGVKC